MNWPSKSIIKPMNDLYFDGKKFISSGRAAKLTGYVNDYIGQLCRDEKLECRMVGRSWYVSLESLLEHKNRLGNGVTSHSSKHVRKVTFLEKQRNEGISKVSQPISPIAQRPAQESPIVVKKQEVELRPQVEPLRQKFEIDKSDLTKIVLNVSKKHLNRTAQFHLHKKNLAQIFPRAVIAMLVIFISLMAFWGALSLNPDQEIVYRRAFDEIQKKEIQILAKVGDSLEANVFSSASSILKTAKNRLAVEFNSIYGKIRQNLLALIGDSKIARNISSEQPKPNQGMVVVPVDEKSDKEKTIAKIKNSFSDEVRVTPNPGGQDGVITPVFKEVKSGDYLYVLVPVKE